MRQPAACAGFEYYMNLFDENIDRSDIAPGGYSEPDFEYLNRSGRFAAGAIRVLLEDWFSRYPKQSKDELRASFRSRDDVQHRSAFFELYIHELLLVHGYQVEVHPKLGKTTKRPDFLARRNGQEVYVEAVVATNSSSQEASAEARLNQVYDALNKVNSPNFFIGIEVYGVPSTPVPLNDLIRAVELFLKELDPDSVNGAMLAGGLITAPRRQFLHEGCTIEFFPIPKSPEARGKLGLRPLGMLGPGEAAFVDDTRALKNALSAKAKRYGELGKPFVIAVNAMAQHLDSIDIADALFGQESDLVFRDINRAGLAKPTRKMKGVWITEKGPINTRITAALIASSLVPWSAHVSRPLLYHNPWAKYPSLDLLPGLTALVPVDNHIETRQGKNPVELFNLPKDLVTPFNRPE
jgi:hypothetical protein